MITDREADILSHASSNGRYVSSETLVINMAERGLLKDYGPQRLAGGDHYLIMTPLGRVELNKWKAVQPRPTKPKKRRTAQFDSWMNYCDACGWIEFGKFVKDIWKFRNTDNTL